MIIRLSASFALLCAISFAQTPSQEISANDAPATFRSRVNLVMVPVVVRDKNGHTIGDLKKEDFQLFDKGKPQVIARFSVEKASDRPVVTESAPIDPTEKSTSAPMAIPTRFVAYVFDDLHTEFPDLARARDAAAKHIRETLLPTDRAAIYTTSGQNMLDFTDDRDKMHAMLLALRARSMQNRRTECPPMTYYMADLIQNRHDHRAQYRDPGYLCLRESHAVDRLTDRIGVAGQAGGPEPGRGRRLPCAGTGRYRNQDDTQFVDRRGPAALGRARPTLHNSRFLGI